MMQVEMMDQQNKYSETRWKDQDRDQSPLEETDDDLHVFKRFDDLTAVK